MTKKVTILHTSFVSVETLNDLCRELLPGTEVRNIVDDSLLPEAMAHNGITPGIIRRMTAYVQQAEDWGADVILNQCSSVREAAVEAAKTIHIPLVPVDLAMAEQAVLLGSRVAVVATVASTMKPSVALVEDAAHRAGKIIDVVPVLVDGALDVLMKEKDRTKHNRLVREAIENIADSVDVIVLAQGSMVLLLDELTHISTPVLTSPRSGIERLREILTT
ncbi:aspartate/glutamate racemase family protein [Spirosoma montaniterrae]|uniref:Asp/Glu/hydantoin racemase n=1 Tax=Spirosoma montaniterrae TaxID=1178516 RepID=A0A1P9WUJ8_9BACT|nr:aspartate/glutamate racemase family protein [Spirosoma montaniterrae]AQG79052.1 Asp/Glu/hydantoin racemase [Spirosoma montaniterrae]